MPFLQFSNSARIPETLRSPLLTDRLGLPRFWVTVWSAFSTRSLALSTETKKLRYIESLYTFTDETYGQGYLDAVLGRTNLTELESILEAYFVSLRNRPRLQESTEKQWQAGLSFVRDVVLRLSKSSATEESLSKAERRFMRLDVLYGQLRIQKARSPDMLRSLPAEVVSYLYEILDPESPQNPFKRQHTRWTAFIAFILMLHQGLRRGELLLLPVDVVKSGVDSKKNKTRHWMNIEVLDGSGELDTRYNRPSIKTVDSIRQVPLSDLTANLIQTYSENYRGKPNHPFLLNTQWNTPLSHESLTVYFSKLSRALPPLILKRLNDRTGKDSIEPHDLRHTCAVVRLNQLLGKGVPMEEALQTMRSFFGWSRTSDMPRRYAKAVFEDRLAGIWSNIMDDRVAILRALSKEPG